jgi:hypothetical protein
VSQITQAPPEPTINGQRPAFEALLGLTAMFGGLPAAYVQVQPEGRSLRVGLQFDTPQDFEQWRTALQIPSASVILRSNTASENVWLSVDGVFRGISVHLTGFGVALSAELAKTYQEMPPTAVAPAETAAEVSA